MNYTIESWRCEPGKRGVLYSSFPREKTHSRTTYLGKATRKVVWRYLVERDSVSPDAPLFVTNEDRPMTRQRVLNLLSNLGKSVGILKVHPHRFRHTIAIQYLRNSGDIFTLQRILVHKRLDMVNRYLYIVSTDIKSAHQRASLADYIQL